MSSYLVIVRHTLDDIPVRLFQNREDAIQFAKDRHGVLKEAERVADEVFGFRDGLTPYVGIDVLEIDDNGVPVHLTSLSRVAEEQTREQEQPAGS